MNFTGGKVEDAALEWLTDLGRSIATGTDIARNQPYAERAE